jgi:hypothetical protein
MKRLSDGKPKADALPIDVEKYLRKTREMRSEPQIKTAAKALNERALKAAVKAARKKARG